MSLILTITDAGRQAIVNAENNGLLPITISHIALGSGRYNAAKTRTALHKEIKRITSFGGSAVANDAIHITIHDESTDTYSLGEFGLITNTGVLFAVYSKAGESILEKNSNGILLLSADVKITTLDITNIIFSGTNFILPPASKTISGVLKLADIPTALAGTNKDKAMTPETTKAVIDDHKNQTAAHHISKIEGGAPLASPVFTGEPATPTPPKGDKSTRVASTALVRNEGKQYPILTGISANTVLSAGDVGKCFVINGGVDIVLPSISEIGANGKTLTFSVGYGTDSTIARLICNGADVIRDINPLVDPASILDLYAAERIEIACDSASSWYVTNWVSRRPLMIESAPTSTETDANNYTRGGHWVTPTTGLINFPQSVMDANTRAIVHVSGSSIGITQTVQSRNGDGRRYHRSASTFAGLAGFSWVEEWNSKNTLKIGTTAESARAALGLPGWMGLGGVVQQVSDMTSTDVNVARIFRMNSDAAGGNGNFTGVLSLPLNGSPNIGYLGITLAGIPYVGRKAGVNSIPSWTQIWDANSQLAIGTTPASARSALNLNSIAWTGLEDSGVAAGNYGNSATIPTLVTDVKGRLTSVTDVPIRQASTTQSGISQLNTAINSTSVTQAATPSAVKAAYDLANSKQAALGYTPVQQGTGTGQTSNNIKIGWSTTSKLKATVDATDQGNFAFEPWVTNNFAANNPTATTAEAQAGTVTALRQWSPDLIRQAITTRVDQSFNSANKRFSTIMTGYGVTGGTCSYWKMGAFVFLNMNVTVNSSSTVAAVHIGFVDDDAKPLQKIFSMATDSNDGSQSLKFEVRPNTTGATIHVYVQPVNGTFVCSMMWRLL